MLVQQRHVSLLNVMKIYVDRRTACYYRTVLTEEYPELGSLCWHSLNITVVWFVGYINDYEERNNMSTHNIYMVKSLQTPLQLVIKSSCL